jgi:hypothetical protein
MPKRMGDSRAIWYSDIDLGISETVGHTVSSAAGQRAGSNWRLRGFSRAKAKELCVNGHDPSRLRSLVAALLALGLAGALIFAWHTITGMDESDIVPPKDFVAEDKRHEGLDATLARGLRYNDPAGGWSISIGSFDIRRASLGFVRVGALNEAVITDLHISFSPTFRVADGLAFLHDLVMESRSEGKSLPRTSRHAAVLLALAKASGSRVPLGGTKISMLRFRNVSLSLDSDGGTVETPLLRAPSLTLASGQVRFAGGILIGNRRGQQAMAREARLSFGDEPMVSLIDATIRDRTATQKVSRLSIPVKALWGDGDLMETIRRESTPPHPATT